MQSPQALILPSVTRENRKRVKRHLLHASFISARPVMFLVRALHVHASIHPTTAKYSISLITIFSGSFMATNPVHGIPHFIWDAIAYTIHGLGAAPIGEDVIRVIKNKQKKQ